MTAAPVDLSRIVGRAAARSGHGDLATNAAMVLAKPPGQKPRALAETLAAALARRLPMSTRSRSPAPASSTSASPTASGRRSSASILAAGTDYGRSTIGAGAQGQCRVRLGQPDRPDACRPLPRRGVRRRAGQPAGLRRLRGHAGILHQRRRRAGRRARPLGLPALPRGARRDDRRDPAGLYPGDYLVPVGAGAGRGVRPRPARRCRKTSRCRSSTTAPSMR